MTNFQAFANGKYYLGLCLAGVFAVVLVRAEECNNWLVAQASLITIVLLLALIVWDLWKANRAAPLLSIEADVYYRATKNVLVCVAVGFTALLLNANRKDHWEHGGVARAMGYGALVAGAFFIAGVLLGYLFGLRPSGAGASQNQPSSSPSPPHTNLEEIADWLTKLILGAGLVELTHLRGPIHDFAVFIAHGVDVHEDPGSPAIALAIMSFFCASGLLYGYLWTRYQQALKLSPDASGAVNPTS